MFFSISTRHSPPPRKSEFKIMFFFFEIISSHLLLKEEEVEKKALCDFSETSDIILSFSIYRSFTFWVIKWLIIVTLKRATWSYLFTFHASGDIQEYDNAARSGCKESNEHCGKRAFCVWKMVKFSFFKEKSRSFFTFPSHIATFFHTKNEKNTFHVRVKRSSLTLRFPLYTRKFEIS